jgi:hypothetical protein
VRAYIKQARAWDRFHFECGIASIVQHDSSVLFIIGIPFGTQHVKGAALTLPSVGTTKVRKERTEAARRTQTFAFRLPRPGRTSTCIPSPHGNRILATVDCFYSLQGLY